MHQKRVNPAIFDVVNSGQLSVVVIYPLEKADSNHDLASIVVRMLWIRRVHDAFRHQHVVIRTFPVHMHQGAIVVLLE